MPNPLTVLPVLDKIFDIINTWQKNRPLNKLRYRIEAAIEYVRLDERAGDYKDLSEGKIKDLKEHFRKRIFDE